MANGYRPNNGVGDEVPFDACPSLAGGVGDWGFVTGFAYNCTLSGEKFDGLRTHLQTFSKMALGQSEKISKSLDLQAWPAQLAVIVGWSVTKQRMMRASCDKGPDTKGQWRVDEGHRFWSAPSTPQMLELKARSIDDLLPMPPACCRCTAA